jgi:integrase
MHQELAKRLNHEPDTLAGIFPLYLAEADIADSTRAKYAEQFAGRIGHYFGHLHPNNVRQTDIAQYLEMRKKDGAAVTGNRERAALSSVFEFALRKGWASTNPCRGVRRNREKPSKVYVTTEDMTATYERSTPALKLVINGLYLTGMRLGDLMQLRRDQLKPEGIELTEGKTGKRNLIEWKAGLRELIRRAIEHGDASATKLTKKLPKARPLPELVFINSRGKPWTQAGISSAMRKAGATFSPRQLRPKAQTDSSDNVLGHTGQMRDRYTRVRKLKPVA